MNQYVLIALFHECQAYSMNAQSYIQKHSYSGALIEDIPHGDLSFSIIIPSYNEPHLLDTLDSILLVQPLSGITEVLVVLNHSENASSGIKELHQMQYTHLQRLEGETMDHRIQIKAILPLEIPDKWAGVGMARKLGMDEAIRRFSLIGKEGILCNIDADCLIDQSYLKITEKFFEEHLEVQACSLGFVHHTANCSEMEREAICWYELHLRLYIGWQKIFQFPFAFQTLGSCFGVRTEAYRQQGGMNRRKAGEDFYFLHKFSAIHKLAAIDKVLVYPSGRISNRVPFGTGKSVGQLVTQIIKKEDYLSYNPSGIEAFCNAIRELHFEFDKLQSEPEFWKNLIREPSLLTFLESIHFEESLKEIIINSAHSNSFEKRLSRCFNPFLLMKYLHYAEQYSFPKIPIMDSFRNYMQACCPETREIEQLLPHQALHLLRVKEYPDYHDPMGNW